MSTRARSEHPASERPVHSLSPLKKRASWVTSAHRGHGRERVQLDPGWNPDNYLRIRVRHIVSNASLEASLGNSGQMQSWVPCHPTAF